MFILHAVITCNEDALRLQPLEGSLKDGGRSRLLQHQPAWVDSPWTTDARRTTRAAYFVAVLDLRY